MSISLRKGVLIFLTMSLLTILYAGEGYGQPKGIFPTDPFNGLQVKYEISGAKVTKFADVPGFTWTRTLTIAGFDGSGDLAISGTLTADWGYYADVVVKVSAGGQAKSETYKVEPKKPKPFVVRVPIPENAKTGGVSIVMTGHYNAGTRGVVVRGSWDTHGQTAPPADPDQNRGPQSPVARMKEILSRYKAAMPVGRAATGPMNNLWADNTGDPRYDDCKCGGYQSKILTLLGKLQYSSNPGEKALIEGYGQEGFEYGPIAGWMGGHQAVVLYPKGTDWRVTGTVLDPWPTQNHEGTPITYPVAEWAKKFPPLEKSGETRNPWARLEYYTGKYFSDAYPNPYDPPKIPAEVTIWMQKQPEALRNTLKSITDPYERYLRAMNEYKNHKNTTTLKAHCPLNVYLMDGQGRVSGFPGGVARLEIPEVLINTLRLADGTYWTELNYPRNTDFKVIFEGTGNGQATVYAGFNMKADAGERRIQKYDLQVVSGQKYSLDQKDENARMRTIPNSADSEPPKPQTIFNNWNKGAVLSGPTSPSVFETLYPLHITYINTYHYHFGRGAPAGMIALRHSDGTIYGPWPAKGVLSSGAPDGTWEVRPGIVIKPGTYTVGDSDSKTWSHNPASGGRGFAEVQGYPVKVKGGGGRSTNP